MKRTLILLSFLALAGCGSQSQTRTEFEADHPWAKIDKEKTFTDDRGNTFVDYVDDIPVIAFDGRDFNRPTYDRTRYTNQYDPAGKILARGEAKE